MLDLNELLNDDWAMKPILFQVICALIPENSRVLELGSGLGTAYLAERYDVFSVEHNKEYVDKYASTYIHAYLNDRWYDIAALEQYLPRDYDLLLVDGPPGTNMRPSFLEHLDLFRLDCIIIVDDIHRDLDEQMFLELCDRLKRPHVRCFAGNTSFGLIFTRAGAHEEMEKFKSTGCRVIEDPSLVY